MDNTIGKLLVALLLLICSFLIWLFTREEKEEEDFVDEVMDNAEWLKDNAKD